MAANIEIESSEANFNLSATSGFARTTIHKHIRQLFQGLLAPLADLNGMHVELGSQLAQRPLAADCFYRHLGLELWTVLLARRRHRFSLRYDSAEF
jgi:hypothetical protein